MGTMSSTSTWRGQGAKPIAAIALYAGKNYRKPLSNGRGKSALSGPDFLLNESIDMRLRIMLMYAHYNDLYWIFCGIGPRDPL